MKRLNTPILLLILSMFSVASCSRPAKQIETNKKKVENKEELEERNQKNRPNKNDDSIVDKSAKPSSQGSNEDEDEDLDSQSKPKLTLKEILKQTGWDGKSNQSFADGWSIKEID